MNAFIQPRTVEVHHDGGRRSICLNRPERHNAFDAQVIAELTEAFEQASQDDDVRVVVLSAKGGTFCAGADLRWMRDMAEQSDDDNLRDAQQLAQLLWNIHHCPAPVVAQVQGDCLGGGVGLVAAADIALASGHAHFALSEVRLGLIPATISPYLVKAMGERQAMRYALTAERFDAHTAWRCGLVHEVMAPMELPERVDELVHQLMQNGPQALRRCKALMHHVGQHPLDEALKADTAQRIAATRASPEGRAGMAAFLARQRQPWQ